MRKIYLFMMISLDGFFEGPDHDLSWHNVDAEFNDFADEQLDDTGTLIFGRRTYQLMAGYWPTPAGLEDDPATAERMNALPKIVFSRTLKTADWHNTELHNGNVAQVVRAAKQQPGQAIAVFGSSNLCLTLLKENLLDELRIMVSPIVLGHGTPLFMGLEKPQPLELTATRTFMSGNVLHTYKVVK